MCLENSAQAPAGGDFSQDFWTCPRGLWTLRRDLRKCEVTQVVLGCPSGSHELVVYLETRSRKVEDKEQKGKQTTGSMASWVDTR